VWEHLPDHADPRTQRVTCPVVGVPGVSGASMPSRAETKRRSTAFAGRDDDVVGVVDEPAAVQFGIELVLAVLGLVLEEVLDTSGEPSERTGPPRVQRPAVELDRGI
jgi:hypothetical protein